MMNAIKAVEDLVKSRLTFELARANISVSKMVFAGIMVRSAVVLIEGGCTTKMC
jgi:hypothetical protein